MRKITLFVLSLVLALGVFSGLLAQTVLISPTGDGGFETGTTFASNGWTEVNATGNNYQIGTAPGGYSGARCGFISNSATTWANTNALAYRHLYRNVTFPANQTEITLTLIYKTNVAQATATDGFTVRMVPTTTTPVTTGYPTGNLIYPGLLYSTTANTWYVISISVPASYAGTTSRLVLSWYNDNANPRTLGAVDDIELTSKVPDTISSLPYTTTMDPVYYPVSLPSGWSHLMSTAYRPWRIATSTTIGSHSEPYFAIVSYSTTAAKNEWMISPPVSVVSGTDYIIKYWVKAPGYGGVPEKLKVHWGTAPTVASLTANTAIYADPNMLIADWTEVVINYTATTTGNIYFGWHAYSALDIDYLAVDDITITRATPTMSISENSWDYGLAFVNDSSCTTRQFTATNTGGGTVTIASGGVTLTGRDAAHFDLTDANSYPINLTAGQSASWTVKFDPTSAGEKQAYLNIVDNTGAKTIAVIAVPNYPVKNVWDYTCETPMELSASCGMDFDVIYLGGLTEDRGIFKILRSVSILRNEFPSLNVLILGKFFDPEVEKQFNEQLNTLNLNAMIYYQSWIPAEKIGLLLKRSRVGLWVFNPQNKRMSRAVPLKVLEYFAAGLPVVSINTPLMRDLVEKNGLGACCEFHSESIAKAVSGILKLKKSEYKLMSQRCGALIDQKYNWEAIEPQLLDLARKLGPR